MIGLNKEHSYRVPAGTAIYTGPLGVYWTQSAGVADMDLLVEPLTPPYRRSGYLGFNVEVVEPRERAGEHLWIAKEVGQTGWIRG